MAGVFIQCRRWWVIAKSDAVHRKNFFCNSVLAARQPRVSRYSYRNGTRDCSIRQLGPAPSRS